MKKKVFNFNLVIVIFILALTLSACSKNGTNNNSTPNGATEQVAEQTTASLTIYTLNDVAQHNSENDCWTIIDGNVYDLSVYIASGQHVDAILDGCGKEASEMFASKDKHKSKKAANLLEGMMIGSLAQ